VIKELSGEIPVKILCKAMGIQRSSFYAWKKHLSYPSEREKDPAGNGGLF
jgi:putative transposase